MKKIIYTVAICFIATQFTACKKETKKEIETVTEKKAAYVLQDADNVISWTAYKTTDKVPVKGMFKKVTITKNGEGNTAKEAINNSSFSIPVSSVFTKDTSRDFKIKKFFFGIMDKTELLSGKLIIENDSIGYSDITMNGITKKLPFKYTLNGNTFSLTGNLKISDWNGEKALASLNDACKDLHKGADGVTKTWDDVAINITSTFK